MCCYQRVGVLLVWMKPPVGEEGSHPSLRASPHPAEGKPPPLPSSLPPPAPKEQVVGVEKTQRDASALVKEETFSSGERGRRWGCRWETEGQGRALFPSSRTGPGVEEMLARGRVWEATPGSAGIKKKASSGVSWKLRYPPEKEMWEEEEEAGRESPG